MTLVQKRYFAILILTIASVLLLLPNSYTTAAEVPLSIQPTEELNAECLQLRGADRVLCYVEHDPILSKTRCANAPDIYTEPHQKQYYQEECYFNLAHKTRDAQYCEQAGDAFKIGVCYTYLAQLTNDARQCDQIPPQTIEPPGSGYTQERCLAEYFSYARTNKTSRQIPGWQNQALLSLFYGDVLPAGLALHLLIFAITMLIGWIIVKLTCGKKNMLSWISIGSLVPFVISLLPTNYLLFISPLSLRILVFINPDALRYIPTLPGIFMFKVVSSIGWLLLFLVVGHLWQHYRRTKERAYMVYVFLFLLILFIANAASFLSLLPRT